MFLILLVVTVLMTPPSLAAAPSLDDQVYDIASQLMCPVCAGQTVAESNSPLAQQMREQIRVRLLRGESHDEIIAYFVSQFGESVLAAPPKRGVGLALWLAPVVALAIGVIVMIRYLRRITGRPASPAG